MRRELAEKDKYYPFCQSCAKKFIATLPCGTKADGTINKALCHECFANGCFIEPDLTTEQIKNRAINQLKNGNNIIRKYALQSRIAKLDRWKSDKYF